MGIIDIIFICILLLGFISGLQKGMLTSFLACIAMAGAWFLSAGFYKSLAELLNGSLIQDWLIKSEVTNAETVNRVFSACSFAFCFFIAFAALLLVVNLINNVLRLPSLRVFDGILGGIFGIARAFVVLLVLVSAIQIVFTTIDAEMVAKLLDGSVIGRAIKNIEILTRVI